MNLVYMNQKPKEYRIPYSSCPLCNFSFTKLESYISTDKNYYELPDDMKNIQWVICNRCEHIFTDGYFNSEALNFLFRNNDAPSKTSSLINIEGRRPFWVPTLDKILGYVKSGKWLDVGAGEGSLLVAAAEYGFFPIALDLDSERVKFLKSTFNIDSYCSDIENFKQKDFDVISFMDVIEHLPFPGKAIEDAHSKLKENGVLVISTPNTESPIWKPMTEANLNTFYWHNLEHYHSFSKKNLYSLLRKTGFEPVNYSISNRYKICMEVIAKKVIC